VFLGFVLSAEIHFDHSLVVLHLLNRPFAKDRTLMENGDLSGDLTHKRHIVLDYYKAVVGGEAD
jgi:hypothetical protein